MRRPFSRDQRTTIIYGMLVFVLIIVSVQLWLLTATMNAYLGGDHTCGASGSGRQPGLLLSQRRLASLRRAHGAGHAGRRRSHPSTLSDRQSRHRQRGSGCAGGKDEHYGRLRNRPS